MGFLYNRLAVLLFINGNLMPYAHEKHPVLGFPITHYRKAVNFQRELQPPEKWLKRIPFEWTV